MADVAATNRLSEFVWRLEKFWETHHTFAHRVFMSSIARLEVIACKYLSARGRSASVDLDIWSTGIPGLRLRLTGIRLMDRYSVHIRCL